MQVVGGKARPFSCSLRLDGRMGVRLGYMRIWCGMYDPLIRLHGLHAVTTFSQLVRPPCCGE